MTKRLGVVGIVVESPSASTEINAVLHESARIIVGRMGIPYRERGLAVISLIVDGTVEEINALTGQLGRVPAHPSRPPFPGRPPRPPGCRSWRNEWPATIPSP